MNPFLIFGCLDCFSSPEKCDQERASSKETIYSPGLSLQVPSHCISQNKTHTRAIRLAFGQWYSKGIGSTWKFWKMVIVIGANDCWGRSKYIRILWAVLAFGNWNTLSGRTTVHLMSPLEGRKLLRICRIILALTHSLKSCHECFSSLSQSHSFHQCNFLLGKNCCCHVNEKQSKTTGWLAWSQLVYCCAAVCTEYWSV